MRYRDLLYGEWELPEIIERLVETPEMARLRGITQDSVPNCLNMYGPMPNRFQHDLGVAYLASHVFLGNLHLVEEYSHLLPAAALLHDAGSPPFSHMGEYFLKELTGKDGEWFLADVLDGSKTERILREYDIFIEDALDFVTGRKQPIAAIINGSLDLDNLDNVTRYAAAAGLERDIIVNPLLVALAFRHFSSSGEWYLRDDCYPEVKKWQRARAAVYGAIYGAPHLSASIMVYRALELAFTAGEVRRDFFFLTDEQALNYLAEHCNRRTAYLIQKAVQWQWYEEVFWRVTGNPTPRLKNIAGHWSGRRDLAETICRKTGLAPEHILVYAGAGRDKRKVTLRFIEAARNSVRYCWAPGEDRPVYRLKIYAPPNLSARTKMKIAKIAAEATM